jgi:glycosyltransferase involved in cell wall biosynthesis
MKILHILYESRDDYFGIGGVGIRAYNIYRYLKERHDITLLCRKYPGAADGEINGLRHTYVGSAGKNFTKALLSYAYHAASFVKKYGSKFDIIIEEFSPAIPTFLNLYRKRPVVLQMQGYTGKEYFKKYNIVYSTVLFIFEKIRPKFYKNIIVVSEATIQRFHLQQHPHIQVISNGISENIFRIEPGESDYILFLGRIDIYQKGLDLLLEAYKNIHRDFPHLKLVVAGDGRDMENFKKLMNGLPEHIQKNIHLPGWVESEKKTSLLRDALMVVVPSRHETQGIVVLEAMAYSKPVVTSNIPEFRYVKDAGAGIPFQAGDALSLADSMRSCISNKDRKSIGIKGRESVQSLTWQNLSLKYERFLLDVLAGSE